MRHRSRGRVGRSYGAGGLRHLQIEARRGTRLSARPMAIARSKGTGRAGPPDGGPTRPTPRRLWLLASRFGATPGRHPRSLCLKRFRAAPIRMSREDRHAGRRGRRSRDGRGRRQASMARPDSRQGPGGGEPRDTILRRWARRRISRSRLAPVPATSGRRLRLPSPPSADAPLLRTPPERPSVRRTSGV
jgi:hypothetical protein